jgi:hypothetical protein
LYSSIRINKGRMSRIESTKRGGMRATAHTNHERIFFRNSMLRGRKKYIHKHTQVYMSERGESRERDEIIIVMIDDWQQQK